MYKDWGQVGGLTGELLGHGFLGFWLINCDCGVNISFVDPTVLISSSKILLVKQGVGFTVDWPEILLGFLESLACSALLASSLASIVATNCLGYNALNIPFGQIG